MREPRGFTAEQTRWLRDLENEINKGFASARDFTGLKYLHAAPTRTFAGMVVMADGSDWDPGSGAGMYRRNEANAAWIFVG